MTQLALPSQVSRLQQPFIRVSPGPGDVIIIAAKFPTLHLLIRYRNDGGINLRDATQVYYKFPVIQYSSTAKSDSNPYLSGIGLAGLGSFAV